MDDASENPWSPAIGKFLSSRLSSIDAEKICGSASRVLSAIRKNASAAKKKSAFKMPDVCKELSEKLKEQKRKKEKEEKEEQRKRERETEEDKEQEQEKEEKNIPANKKLRESDGTADADRSKEETGEDAQTGGNKVKDAGEEGGKGAQKQDVVYSRKKNKDVDNREKPLKNKRNKPDMDPLQILPAGSNRMRVSTNKSVTKIKSRVWLPDHIIEKVYNLVIECKEQVILNFGEISMTGSQVEQSFQGGEGARHLIIGFMECLKKDVDGNLRNKIFVPPLDKNDQDMEERIKHALPSYKGRSKTSPTFPQRFIYCPVLHSGEWIVVCFQLKDVSQIHVLCRTDVFGSIKSFCLSLGLKLDNALKECGYKTLGFSDTSNTKISHIASSIKPNASVFASMFFLEEFNGVPAAVLAKLHWNDDQWEDTFIKTYKEGLLPYLICHKENTADVPSKILQLVKTQSKIRLK